MKKALAIIALLLLGGLAGGLVGGGVALVKETNTPTPPQEIGLMDQVKCTLNRGSITRTWNQIQKDVSEAKAAYRMDDLRIAVKAAENHMETMRNWIAGCKTHSPIEAAQYEQAIEDMESWITDLKKNLLW